MLQEVGGAPQHFLEEWLFFLFSADVLSGCVAFEPSRYTANALIPYFHAIIYASTISSFVASLDILNVFEIAPDTNG